MKFASVKEASAALALLGGNGASAAPATTSPSAATGSGAASGKPEKSSTPKAPKYEETELPALIQKLAKTKREGVMAVLKGFGAAKGAELKPEQFADAIAKLKAIDEPDDSA